MKEEKKSCGGCGLSLLCGSRKPSQKTPDCGHDPLGASEVKAIVLALVVPVVIFLTVLLTVGRRSPVCGILLAFATTIFYFFSFRLFKPKG